MRLSKNSLLVSTLRWLPVLVLSVAAVLPAHAASTAAGVTEPLQDVVLSATVAGTVGKRLVKEGDAITAGQTLVEMKKRQEELEVERRKLIMLSKAELDAAKVRVSTLKTDLDSTRKLFEATKSVSKDDLAKKDLEYQLAVADMDKLQMTEEREVLEHSMAEELLQDRIIKSPLNGYVVELFRQVGEDCKAQEPLVRVVDTKQFYFVANVEAKSGYNLKVGQQVQVEVEAGTTTLKVPGKVSFVSPVVDAASGLIKVKVLCDNADGKVKPGVAGVMHF